MDFRRCFGLRAPRPIGDSTILVPQLENYSLFASPYLDLNKISFEGVGQGDKKSHLEESAKEKTTRQKAQTSTKKEEEGGQKLSKETSKAGDSFGIVLNAVTVKPEHLAITFGKGNEIEVKVQQKGIKSEFGSIPFSRNCTHKYELPNDVDKNSLIALWTSDDYLIILPNDQLRKDLFQKSIEVPEELAKSSDNENLPKMEASKSEDKKVESVPGPSNIEEARSKKPSRSKDCADKIKPKKASDKDGDELVTEKGNDSSKSESEYFKENCSIPVHRVTKVLRPGMDIFMLRKYMVDLESYMSTARKFIENSSFLLQNSKSAERCIRFYAKTYADEFFEEPNLKDNRRRRKKRDPSPDSGYTSNTLSDDSSRGNQQQASQTSSKKLQESYPHLTKEISKPEKKDG